MTLIMILLAVFAGIALMVIFGERFGKPMGDEEQAKYSKIIPILVFILLIGSLIKMFI
ncbi:MULTISPECIES: hypothetical protein [unclassified Colwellia]|uniref:hypothetical protein n=1 Tax=unclassified Colwellia TaxID=196834 RepID=UPI0015F35A33|nr:MULTISPECIES: hypothetical protein [unclassified Colwellia]MBA6231849.1 hypothetical protein [Colwellia sp. MB02u-7]MBA6235804.1 hypothetical protein [Colwellia sp. MB02u-11]MBA6254951.1 hypothetical protein [Colwellia sp. MB3u-28]MBA6259098.1 hypothetical protein [Colwellia sp. MB3u-41]MBA6298893.1 hypothetical protein [Colwellia sp. MB3u-22]